MFETSGRIGGQMHKQINYQNGPPNCPPFLSVSSILPILWYNRTIQHNMNSNNPCIKRHFNFQVKMAIENWTKLSIVFFHFCIQNCKMLKIANFHFSFLNLEIKICEKRLFHFSNLLSKRKIQNYIKYDIFKFCLKVEKSKLVICHYP